MTFANAFAEAAYGGFSGTTGDLLSAMHDAAGGDAPWPYDEHELCRRLKDCAARMRRAGLYAKRGSCDWWTLGPYSYALGDDEDAAE